MKTLNTYINKKCYVTSKFMQQPRRHSLDIDILEFPKHSNAVETTIRFISEVVVAPPPKKENWSCSQCRKKRNIF